jgi:hypothetical protein
MFKNFNGSPSIHEMRGICMMKLLIIGITLFVLVVYSISRIHFMRKWILLYSTFKDEDYFQIAAKLDRNGIRYTTKARVDFRNLYRTVADNKQIDIYVKKEDEHKAVEALRKNI